jgi:TP901 family phage tail tape measure protein
VINLGSAYGEIQIGTGDAERSVASLAATLRNVGTTMSLALSAPLAGLAAAGLVATAGFETSMNQLQVIAGATEAQMQSMQDAALELGAATSFSSGEAAEGMLELAKAGLSTDQVLASIGGTLDLAAAGGLSVAQAAEISANALNTFGLNASEAGRVADMLAAAANSSSVEVTDMAMGMQMAGAVFAANQVPIEDLSTAIALLGNNGIKGSDAGTSLKTMLMRLTAPTDEAAAVMRRLGIQVYNADGSMRGFEDIVGQLESSTSGLTDEQRNLALTTMFGADAIRAANVLIAEGADSYAEMKGQVMAAGAAGEVADSKLKGLAGAIEYAKGSVESALITAFLPFTDMLGGMIRQVADAVSAFAAMPEPLRNAALAFTAVLAAAGPVMVAISTIGAVLGALAAPVGLVALAVAALAAAWAGNFLGLRDATAAAWSAVLPYLQQAYGWVMAQLPVALGVLQGAWSTVWSEIQAVTAAAWSAVLPVLASVRGWLQRSIPAAVAGLSTGWAAAWKWMSSTLSTALAEMGTAIATIGSYLTATVETGDDRSAFGYIRKLPEWLQGPTLALGEFVAAFSNGMTTLRTAWVVAWNRMSGSMSAAWGRIRRTLGELPALVKRIVDSVRSGTFDWRTLIPDLNWGSFVAALDWGAFVGALGAWSQYVGGLAWSGFVGVLDWAAGFVQALDWGSFVETLTDWSQYVTTLAWSGFVGVLDWAAGFVQSLDWGTFVETLTDWSQYVTALAWSGFVGVLDWASGFVQALDWGTFVETLTDWSQYVGGLAWSGFVGVLDWASGFVQALDWGTFVESLTDWSQYVTALAWSGFVGVLDWAAGFVQTLDWGSFVKSLTDWSQYVTALAWSGFVGVLDWAAGFVQALDWGTFVETLTDWSQYVGGLAWSGFVGVLDWAAGFVQALDWGTFVKSLTDWSQYVTALAWENFVKPLDLSGPTGAIEGVKTVIDGLYQTVATVWPQIEALFGPALERLQTAFGTAGEDVAALGPHFTGLLEAIQNMWTAVQPILTAFGTLIGAVVAVVGVFSVNLLASMFERLGGIVETVVTQVTNTINMIATVLSELTALVMAIVQGDWAAAWQAAENIVGELRRYFQTTINNMGRLVGIVFGAIYDAVVNTLTDVGVDAKAQIETIKTWWTTKWTELKNNVQPVIDVVEALQTAIDNFREWLSGVSLPNPFQAIGDAAQGVADAVNSALGGGQQQPAEQPAAEGSRNGRNAGRSGWRSGVSWLGERAPELVDLPRRALVSDGQEPQRMAGRTLNITVPVQNVGGPLDLVELAHRVAGVIMQYEGA